jgi:hypothetical protein
MRFLIMIGKKNKRSTETPVVFASWQVIRLQEDQIEKIIELFDVPKSCSLSEAMYIALNEAIAVIESKQKLNNKIVKVYRKLTDKEKKKVEGHYE